MSDPWGDTPVKVTREIIEIIFNHINSANEQLFFLKVGMIGIIIWLILLTWKIRNPNQNPNEENTK